MASSPTSDELPSSPLTASTADPSSPRARGSIEAFPEFDSSPASKPSPASHSRTQSHNHLEIPGAQALSQRPNRPIRSPSQRLPPIALLSSTHNGSRNDLASPTLDRDEQPQQSLPRPLAAPSLSGPSIRPSSMVGPAMPRQSAVSMRRSVQPNPEEIKSESLWADMQRTLADVELSAMSSSHLFNARHSQALEKLREKQLALAQAWARSEADETTGQESEDEYLDSEPEEGMQAGELAMKAGENIKSTKGKGGKDPPGGPKPPDPRKRESSFGSRIGKDLEAETERDIKMARKRREANDKYFSQVNHGVLDVVARLDEVADAMRRVEKESRAVWEEMGDGDGGATNASATDLDGGGGDTDGSDRSKPGLRSQLSKITTTTATGATESGTELSDSPTTPRKPNSSDQRAKDSKGTTTTAAGASKGR